MIDYDKDFFWWTQAQAEALRASEWTKVDGLHVAEEIADLGKREYRAMESYLEIIQLHLLKWACQPARRSRSWEKTLLVTRHRLGKLLQRSPALRHQLPYLLPETLEYARKLAALETGLPADTFRRVVSWEIGQILDEHFLPEEDGTA